MRTLGDRFQCSIALIAAAIAARAVSLPAGSELHIRLTAALSTKTAQPGDAVPAILIAGAAAGTPVAGVVTEARASSANHRAVLRLDFPVLHARVAAVDNARETVDGQGRILGILASETASGQLDQAIADLTQRYEGLGGVLGAVKGAILNGPDPDIVYAAGVEMTLRVTEPVTLPTVSEAKRVAAPAHADALRRIAEQQPVRTIAEQPRKESDITNLLLVGTREQVERAFAEAGWQRAAAAGAQSKLESVRAWAENRGYAEAPVSLLRLAGRAPDLVFEKGNNTVARRHHVRLWLRPQRFDGRPVWVGAATHDIGILFAEESRTFMHRIDEQVDREREKVLDDLLLTRRVASSLLVDRAKVPRQTENATGDRIVTDGAIEAVLLTLW